MVTWQTGSFISKTLSNTLAKRNVCLLNYLPHFSNIVNIARLCPAQQLFLAFVLFVVFIFINVIKCNVIKVFIWFTWVCVMPKIMFWLVFSLLLDWLELKWLYDHWFCSTHRSICLELYLIFILFPLLHKGLLCHIGRLKWHTNTTCIWKNIYYASLGCVSVSLKWHVECLK